MVSKVYVFLVFCGQKNVFGVKLRWFKIFCLFKYYLLLKIHKHVLKSNWEKSKSRGSRC